MNRQVDRIVEWINSEEVQDYKTILDFAITIMAFIWLLKNHKIIKK